MAARRKITPLRNMTEIIQAARYRGSHFFDPGTMRRWQSRMSDDVYVTKFGTFFITSERDRPFTYSDGTHTRGAWDGQRRYTVRFIACRPVRHESYGHVYTSQRAELISTSADDFGRFATLSAARTFARGERDRLAGLLIKDNPVLFTGSKEDNS